jgi:TP901 family phage tail tape measure protein
MVNGGAIRAGRAFVELFMVDKELAKGLKAAQFKLRQFSGTVRALGTQMVGFGGGLLVGLGAATKVAADFERQMAFVSTMLTEPEKHMDRFSREVRRMSVEFGESTETLSKGLYDILSASIAPEHALNVLAVSARAAQAGLTDTAVAADAITTILNAYGLGGERAADVSDLLFSVVQRGKTTFAELAPSIGMVATIAASAGVPLEEMGAALATMTRYGVQTENAVVALNAIISSFLKPEKKAAEYAHSLGFELSSATIQAEGLAGVFKRIAGLPPEAIARLFPNVRALRGVLPALQNMEGFLGDITIMSERSGATMEAFGKMAETSGHSLAQLKQAAAEVARTVGEALLPTVGRTASGMRDWLEAHKGLLAGMAPLAAGIGIVAVAGGGLLIVAGMLVSAVAALLSPIGLMVGSVALLAGGLGALVIKGQLAGDGMARTREEIERQGREAGKLLGQYEELVRKTARTAEEELNLELVTKRLKDLYPQYADALDGTAESLDRLLQKTRGMSQMQAGLELETTGQALAELEAKIEGMERTAEMFEKARKELREEMKQPAGLGERWIANEQGTYDRYIQQLQQIYEATRQAKEQLQDLKDYREQLQGTLTGGAAPAAPAAPAATAGAVTEASGAAGASGAAAKPDDEATARERERIEKTAMDRLVEQRLKGIDDELTREMALVAWRYQREIEEAQKAGADIAAIELAKQEEMQQTWLDFQKKKEEEAKRSAERTADFDKRTAEDTQDLMVDAYMPPGLEHDLSHLGLEMQRALADAAEVGGDQDAVRREFELKAELMARGVEGARTSVAGTFSAEAAAGMGAQGEMGELLQIQRDSRRTLDEIARNITPQYGA